MNISFIRTGMCRYANGSNMNLKLNRINNWLELARKAEWSVASLAKLCGVSRDTLCRHFRKQTGKPTHVWLSEQRQQQAIVLLRDGHSVKETAFHLGYKQQTNFTRKFKISWGACPSQTPLEGDKMTPVALK
jgi:AraC-like DNA-binding protein